MYKSKPTAKGIRRKEKKRKPYISKGANHIYNHNVVATYAVRKNDQSLSSLNPTIAMSTPRSCPITHSREWPKLMDP
jgi:hypothetical protein